MNFLTRITNYKQRVLNKIAKLVIIKKVVYSDYSENI